MKVKTTFFKCDKISRTFCGEAEKKFFEAEALSTKLFKKSGAMNLLGMGRLGDSRNKTVSYIRAKRK